MNHSLRSLLLLSGLMTALSSLQAHGPQLQITNVQGKIVTREIFLDEPYEPLTDPKSVYLIPLRETGGQFFTRPNDEEAAPGIPAFNSGPGLAYGLNSTFNPGFQFRLNLVNGLLWWDGSSFVDPGLEQIQAFRGSLSNITASAITSDAGPFGGINFPIIPANYAASAHNSASFRLLGDGVSPTAPSDDGVYLLSLQLTSTDTSLSASDPYYFVLYKNVPIAQAFAAAGSLGFAATSVQVVPEASSVLFSIIGLAGMGFFALRKRE